jgi:peptidoglycan/LPS O-acetylase OafA/YrhL
MNPMAGRHRLEEVDVLRGFAAVWVMLSHYGPHWNDHIAPTLVIVPLHAGIWAVKLFFVISGFVIFMTLERCRSVTDFAVLRFSRLYPAYWASLIFATVVSVAVFGDQFWPGGFLANLTMFQEFLGFGNYDNVYWSLTVELAFYLNAAWLFALGLHRRVTGIVLVWLIGSVAWALFVRVPGTEHRDWVARLFAFDHAPYFAMGIVFFEASRAGWSRMRGALIALAILVETLLNGWVGLGVSMFVATVFYLALSGRLAFLPNRITLWLGGISYCLYLIHRNLGYKSLDWLHAHDIGPTLAISITMIGALLLATALSFGIERPALAVIRKAHARWDAHRTAQRASIRTASRETR